MKSDENPDAKWDPWDTKLGYATSALLVIVLMSSMYVIGTLFS